MTLDLTTESKNVFSSNLSGSYNARALFGGTILAQSVMAAYQLVRQDMFLHSMNVYFLQRGTSKLRTDYVVDSMLDSRSFSKYVVTVKQNDTILAKMQLSFKLDEPDSNFSYIPEFPKVERYENLKDSIDIFKETLNSDEHDSAIKDQLKSFLFWLTDFPLTARPLDPEVHGLFKVNTNNTMSKWLKISDEQFLQLGTRYAGHVLLAFMSDFGILSPVVTMHNHQPIGFIVSLDHAMWFHSHNFDPRQWFLYQATCIYAQNGTSLNRGSIWTESGQLVASVSQEGLIRPKLPKL